MNAEAIISIVHENDSLKAINKTQENTIMQQNAKIAELIAQVENIKKQASYNEQLIKQLKATEARFDHINTKLDIFNELYHTGAIEIGERIAISNAVYKKLDALLTKYCDHFTGQLVNYIKSYNDKRNDDWVIDMAFKALLSGENSKERMLVYLLEKK